MDKDKLWNLVKKVKRETALDKNCDVHSNYLYQDTSDMESQVTAVEHHLGLISSEIRLENLTRSDMKVAAEMFFYLTACPGKVNTDIPSSSEVWKVWFQAWYRLYDDLFKTQSPYQIVLTLNRLMKSDESTDENFIRNKKLLRRVSTLLNLKYEQIRSMLPGAKSNTQIQGDNEEINIDGKS